jgi:hypothetical protein
MITLTQEHAALLEKQLGGMVRIGGDVLVPVAALDGITDDEYEFIARRLRTGGPLYHAGGPG